MELKLAVPEISCAHCKSSIEGALLPLGGVRRASVEVDAKTVEVDFDPDAIDREGIVAAIQEAGYEVPAQV